MSLSGKTVLMSGGSRGIGLAIALRAAGDGANLAILAKTADPHPKLEGTVFTAAAQIEAAGGQALPLVGDVRNDGDISDAVAATVERFGGIDIVINNASAINLAGSQDLPMKAYDLMQDINCRGTFLLTRSAVPHLRRATNPHILTLSPPIDLAPRWPGENLGYTIAKYGMSLCTLGFAEELRSEGIAANSLWPYTTVDTAAIRYVLGGSAQAARSRKPSVMADAAYAVLTRDSRSCSGNFYTDEQVLREEGVTDFSGYANGDGADLDIDIFLDGWQAPASLAGVTG